MSKKKLENFGSEIKDLRKQKGLPLRVVAAGIDIDPSTLGKFEKNTRRPNHKIIDKISKFYKVDFDEMVIKAISDKLVGDLKDEKMKFEIIRATEKKLKSLTPLE